MASEGRGQGERRMLERIEVRRSAIHGRGVFARRRIRNGTRIGRFEGEHRHSPVAEHKMQPGIRLALDRQRNDAGIEQVGHQ